MQVQIVVAADENNAIGKDNQLPWHLPNDLKFFKEKTLGAPVIMGRKTFESIGKPLPKRTNFIITRNEAFPLPAAVMRCNSLFAALDICQEQQVPLVSIIGGGEIFKEAIPLATRIWFTRVHTIIQGAQVFFPALEKGDWEKVWQAHHEADTNHAVSYTFEEWQRR